MKLEWILVHLVMKMALEKILLMKITFVAQKLTAMSHNLDCLKYFLHQNRTLFEVFLSLVLDQNFLHLSHLGGHSQNIPLFFTKIIN